jgi:UDP-N-acetylmuramoyl-tripeptide--D-alanyl-D-alanine ligase
MLIDDENIILTKEQSWWKTVYLPLQELAKFHRKYLNLPIIALTGSNGKNN